MRDPDKLIAELDDCKVGWSADAQVLLDVKATLKSMLELGEVKLWQMRMFRRK